MFAISSFVNEASSLANKASSQARSSLAKSRQKGFDSSLMKSANRSPYFDRRVSLGQCCCIYLRLKVLNSSSPRYDFKVGKLVDNASKQAFKTPLR